MIIIVTVLAVGGFLLHYFGMIDLPFGVLAREVRISTPLFFVKLPLGTILLLGILLVLLLDYVVRLLKK